MSVSEHAVFACEFAGGGGDKRRSGGRKSSVSVWISASEFALYTDKQEVVDFLAIKNNILIYSLFHNYYFQNDIPI